MPDTESPVQPEWFSQHTSPRRLYWVEGHLPLRSSLSDEQVAPLASPAWGRATVGGTFGRWAGAGCCEPPARPVLERWPGRWVTHGLWGALLCLVPT